MFLSQVKGNVVSTAKVESLGGKKLMLVEIVTVRGDHLEGTGRHMVCIDAVGAGKGELVLVVMGSSARMAPQLGDTPTDAVIVAIIDSLHVLGEELALVED